MAYTQETRRMSLQTPLGQDELLIRSLDGSEGLSQLYHYQIEAMAPVTKPVDFGKLLGQMVVVAIAIGQENKQRYIHGLVHRVARGESNTSATAYRLEVGPPIWPMTKRVQSRIFQQETVPDILKKVLAGVEYKAQLVGTFEPRDYCVQYNESDFQFFSRLCEEEGIYYYFEHEETVCRLVLANTPQSHPELPEMPEIRYRPQAEVDTEIIYAWEKTQALKSSKITLWDHHDQLPGKSLEASQTVQPTVTVGRETNKLTTPLGELEQYHYPGGFAERFDGISPSGGPQSSNLQKIFEDNVRTVGIRMQQETADAMVLTGQTDFVGMMHGHKFTLTEHPTDNGEYVLTDVHSFIPQAGSYDASVDVGAGDAHVTFSCVPVELPFRPARITPKPVIYGSQTAYVVGPGSDEIFVDPYGRVKVAFHWDRNAKVDDTSSCWIRVGQGVAGKNWGSIWIPRVGQEVIVSFLDGDPDRPIIVGAVYNPECMPPYELPEHQTRSTFKTNSSTGGGGFNELRFEDKKDNEQIFIHAEKNLDVRVKQDEKRFVKGFHHSIVKEDQLSMVDGEHHETVKSDRISEIKGSHSLKIANDQDVKIGTKFAVDSGQEVHLKAGMKMILEAGTQLSLKVGGNFLDIGPSGVSITGTMVNINSGGSAGSGSGVTTKTPTEPEEADDANPGSSVRPAPRSYQPPGAQALAFQRAALTGAPFCDI